MGIKIERSQARAVMGVAVRMASSSIELPEYWLDVARRTFGMEFKTYTPALGAALLARAVNSHVDPLSLKAEYGSNTFSLRSVGHRMLIPFADEYGFSVRTTKREPLNNQPFFRYNHLSEVDRVRNRAEFDWYVNALKPLVDSNHDEALLALAAYVRIGFEYLEQRESFVASEDFDTFAGLLRAVGQFFRDANDLPRRAQAFVAASFDSVYPGSVLSRAINDPSRDVPGDVQVLNVDGEILASIEVRTKAVPSHEVRAFAASCREAGIDRVVIAEFTTGGASKIVNSVDFDDVAYSHYRLPSVLLQDLWTLAAPDTAVACGERFLLAMVNRLIEIESPDQSIRRWLALAKSEGILSNGSDGA